MDAEGLKELFEPFGAVSLKRMFSGHGVYADSVCFAVALRGEVYLRTDEKSAAALAAAGSAPFAYERREKLITTNLWRLPASAYDDPDELKLWSAAALEAARAIEAVKARKARSREAKAGKAGRTKAPAGKRRAARRT